MKYLWLISAVIVLSGCQSAASPAKSLEAANALCEKTVRNYALLRDEGPAEDYADLFTADGTFTLGENVTRGRQALIARHKAANAAALWRHNILDVKFSDTGGTLSGVSRFMIYTAPHPAPAKNPREIIGDYVDTFVMENGHCRISSRSVRIIFDSSP